MVDPIKSPNHIDSFSKPRCLPNKSHPLGTSTPNGTINFSATQTHRRSPHPPTAPPMILSPKIPLSPKHHLFADMCNFLRTQTLQRTISLLDILANFVWFCYLGI